STPPAFVPLSKSSPVSFYLRSRSAHAFPTLPPSFSHTHPAPTDIYPLSLHDALPIFEPTLLPQPAHPMPLLSPVCLSRRCDLFPDRKSTRLNSSHQIISYAVFCLKKKKQQKLTAVPMK